MYYKSAIEVKGKRIYISGNITHPLLIIGVKDYPTVFQDLQSTVTACPALIIPKFWAQRRIKYEQIVICMRSSERAANSCRSEEHEEYM
jgi:hypothetical protein